MTASRPVNEEQNFFASLAFLTHRKPVAPSNPLQLILDHTQVKSLRNLGDYGIAQFKANLRILPQKEQDLIRGVLQGTHQKVLAAKFALTQAAISARISKAVRRLLFYRDLPKLTEGDYRELRKRFSSLDVDITRWMIATTCQAKTAELVREKYGTHYLMKNRWRDLPFGQMKVRYRWKKMLSKIEGIPQFEKINKAMNLVDKNLYILHEVRFPPTWKQNRCFPHPWKKAKKGKSQ